MRTGLLGFLTAHPTLATFAWGAFKALIPIPSPSFFLLAGAELARAGAGPWEAFALLLLRVALPGAAGGVLGAYPYYYVSRRGGWPLVQRWAPWLGVKTARLDRWESAWTARKGKRKLALMTAATASLLLGAFLAGIGEAGVWEYAVWAFLGGAVRCLLLGAAGWRMRAFGDPAAVGSRDLALGAALLAVVVVWVLARRARSARAPRK